MLTFYECFLLCFTSSFSHRYSQAILESGIVGEQFVKLKRKIKAEVALQKELARVLGMMELVVAAGTQQTAGGEE